MAAWEIGLDELIVYSRGVGYLCASIRPGMTGADIYALAEEWLADSSRGKRAGHRRWF